MNWKDLLSESDPPTGGDQDPDEQKEREQMTRCQKWLIGLDVKAAFERDCQNNPEWEEDIMPSFFYMQGALLRSLRDSPFLAFLMLETIGRFVAVVYMAGARHGRASAQPIGDAFEKWAKDQGEK